MLLQTMDSTKCVLAFYKVASCRLRGMCDILYEVYDFKQISP